MTITLQFKNNRYRINSSQYKSFSKRLHRLNGKPAYQSWYLNGQKSYEGYFEHGKRHRLKNKPSRQHWYESGQKWHEDYYECGNPLHKRVV